MSMDSGAVVEGLVDSGVPRILADELMAAFVEAKRRFYLGDFRPNAVEGGRFAEAAFRILQWATAEGGEYKPLGQSMPGTDQLLRTLINTQASDSIRKHIPRALQVIYDVRNNRDAAHLGDDIDPNLQDASLVVNVMSWVLAEFVRMYHSIPADEAQQIIDQVVTRDVPIIQEVRGVPRVLSDLSASDHCLVLLHSRGEDGIAYTDLSAWVRPKMRRNLRRTLSHLIERDMVHRDGDTYLILRPGERHVESHRLVEPMT